MEVSNEKHMPTQSRLERFVAIYMPHGVAKELYRPGPDFDLRNVATSLAPFDDPAKRSLRDQLLVIEGIDLTTGVVGGTAGHDGSRVILTGSAGNGVNASLDQFLAVERGLGSATPLASLVLGVGNPRPDLGQCISYAAGGGALPKIVNPSESFREIFGKRLAGQDPVALARMDVERRRGQSMIDALRADLSSLSLRVDARDRAKLDQHLTALRELEKGIAKFELTCTPPSAPNDAQFSKVLAYGGGEPYFETITNLQIDLLVAAFACGVTRFATLFLADLSRTRLDPALPDDVHTNVAHRYAASGRRRYPHRATTDMGDARSAEPVLLREGGAPRHGPRRQRTPRHDVGHGIERHGRSRAPQLTPGSHNPARRWDDLPPRPLSRCTQRRTRRSQQLATCFYCPRIRHQCRGIW